VSVSASALPQVRTAPPAVRPDHTVRCAETTPPTHPGCLS
jgi:hypothetical protein